MTALDTLVRRGADRLHPVGLDFDEEFRLLETRIDRRLKRARIQDRLRGTFGALAVLWSGLATNRT